MLSTCRNVARFQHDFKFDGFEDGTLQRKARRSTWHKSNAHVCSHFGVTPLLCSLLLNSKLTREHGTLILHYCTLGGRDFKVNLTLGGPTKMSLFT